MMSERVEPPFISDTVAAEAVAHVAASWFTTGGLDNPVRAEQFVNDLRSHGYRIVREAEDG